MKTLYLAGGCFWGMEDLFRKRPGVTDTDVGYSGGNTDSPKYSHVSTGQTGHAEALKVIYDESKTSYIDLLKFFFKIHNPTTINQQGNDIGSQYRSVIFYQNEEEKSVVLSLISDIDQSGVWKKPIVTEVVPFKNFYLAESDHQDYLVQYPDGYTCHYVRDIKI